MHVSLRPLSILALFVLLVLVVYQEVGALGMLGWDGWPLVAASQVSSIGDLFGTFGEKLMDGRYPHGEFYRPITHLAFALDEALHGLAPRGYHLTDQLLLATCAAVLAGLVAKLGGGLAGVLAGLVFLLHPAQLEVLPVPARRADTLALLFGLACLWTHADGPRTHGRRVLVGLLAFAAAGSKETGVWIAPAIVAWCLVRGEGPLARRWLPAVPALSGVALYVILRTVVLGGLGGHAGEVGPTVSTTELWAGLLVGVLAPEPVLGLSSTALAWTVAVLLAVAACAGMRRQREALLVLGAIALSVLALTSLADRLHSWYAMSLVAPLAGLVGISAARGLEGVRGGHRGAGVLALAGSALVALTFVLGAPLVHDYPRLRGASRWVEERSEALVDLLERRAAPGAPVRISGWPIGIPPAEDNEDVQSLALSQAYTVAAFLELRFPDELFEVRLADEPQEHADRQQVVLETGPPPAWVLAGRAGPGGRERQ